MSPPASRTLRAADLEALAVGLCLLGSGGAGDPQPFASVLRSQLGNGELVLHAPGGLGGASVVPVGMVGATSVFTEKLPHGGEFGAAVAATGRWTGAAPDAVMGIETAGLNGVTALVAALRMGLPYVDADLAGRGLPRLDQLTWVTAQLPLTPCALAFPGGHTLLVDSASATEVERTIRAALAGTGGWAALALPPSPAALLDETACVGTLGRALELGRAHDSLRVLADAAEVAEVLGGEVLGEGRVHDVLRHSAGGGLQPESSVTVLDRNGPVLRIETENEFLMVLVDGEPRATVPDLICLLDRRTNRPLAVDALRRGDEVFVVVLPAPAWWLAPGRLDRVSPAAFAIDSPPLLLGGRP
ncbi:MULTISPECIES: DUF917 domain-containing protein [unclassified Nocardioides]|uniref:DUF917 domain-containing protein n=1 Tax=unclassified Nocardioides TaxID=2615069 RepID=UPI0000EB6083|nr:MULTISPECIES: DUF917 domain-containing protein [unclassified Nocardioides]ABL79643.1 protein of unknown function DUF917 [Nocardioides sp. JS614]